MQEPPWAKGKSDQCAISGMQRQLRYLGQASRYVRARSCVEGSDASKDAYCSSTLSSCSSINISCQAHVAFMCRLWQAGEHIDESSDCLRPHSCGVLSSQVDHTPSSATCNRDSMLLCKAVVACRYPTALQMQGSRLFWQHVRPRSRRGRGLDPGAAAERCMRAYYCGSPASSPCGALRFPASLGRGGAEP